MTATPQTIERARQIGQQLKEVLASHGFKVNTLVRTWSNHDVEELRRLPQTSAILGLVITGGGRAHEAAPLVSGYGAEVALIGDNVLALEVPAVAEESLRQ